MTNPMEVSTLILPGVSDPSEPLADLVLGALSDASHRNPKCCWNVSISIAPEIRTELDAREIVRDWVLMLAELAHSSDATLTLAGRQKGPWVELQLRLTEPDPIPDEESQEPFLMPDRAASAVMDLGGDFRVTSNYPETSVWLKLRAAAA